VEHGEVNVSANPRPYHLKPGFKTSEFWIALVVMALTTLIVGVQVRDRGINLPSSVAIASAAFTSFGYSRCRAQAKSGS
jgi:hypothetical protein